ncbi:MAG: TVP38/TMEM64 family protein [Candidatus Omnitrophica bacterium]|nr:TVP38/TMEM64 family protein [Candidatus Omnitrophota bacterium]
MKKKILARVSLVILVAAAVVSFHKTGALQSTLNWIEGSGIWGPFIFIGVYILSILFFIPSFVFTFSGGVLFGLWKGTVLSLLANGAGSVCALLMGRYLARNIVEKKFAHRREFERIAQAVQKKGWKMIALARVSPVFPFLIGNYAFGVTRIPAWKYFLASVLGSIPSAAVYTYAGFVTGSLASLHSANHGRTPGEWLLLILGLAGTIFLTVYLQKIVRQMDMEN